MTETAAQPQQPRWHTLDVVRGFIIALMALDHARMFIARSHPSEYWGVPLPHYDSAAPFLVRLVTHLCAPGFFFLLGVGVIFLAQRRQETGWSDRETTRHLLLRGAVLLLVQHLVINPAWALGGAGADIPIERYGLTRRPGTEGNIFIYIGVISSLGASLIIGALTRRAPRWALVVMGAVAALLTPALLPSEPFTDPGVALRLLSVPGQSGPLQVLYPVLPWLTATFWGMAFGSLMLEDRPRALRWSGALGAGLLVLFVVLRVSDSDVGNFHAVEPSWIGWLNVTKYPPSAAYLALTLGVVLLLIAIVERVSVLQRLKPLQILGGVSLFFYVVHLYAYGILGWAFGSGTSLGVMMVMWILGLVALYPLCLRYRDFKRGTPADSIWRLF